jgi:acetyl-CoA synthetase
MGRIDDVMNVSGHRLSTAEVESAIVARGNVALGGVTTLTDLAVMAELEAKIASEQREEE